jgi:hypothetical protein
VSAQDVARHLGGQKRRAFLEEVHSDDPDLASCLRIEERELEAGGLN